VTHYNPKPTKIWSYINNSRCNDVIYLPNQTPQNPNQTSAKIRKDNHTNKPYTFIRLYLETQNRVG
jgi:hypothetical protein